ncbi:hypothetical protein [Bifidobacterium avesanii]|uniref:DUF559 domain-containing protein n=1 Tax=Bifidobacterium avesanii TaxID=1798157 RepID=A0A7K3TIR5_9BIFI|nr:hypothetical protein [Bifidobacterium avesanii]KAB8294647.1 hypothetical protein DSM100685_0440 [Bifidobacterium avesanii]NEG78153.1 hypothetical protein [Bifidobacterium avesanii]
MFEFRQEPSTSHIMRHASWATNQSAVAACRSLNAAVRRDLTYGLSTATNLLGRQVPRSFPQQDGRPFAIFPEPSAVRRAGMAERRAWRPLGAPGAIITVNGIQCTSPAATLCHMAACCSLTDLVVLGDSFLCRDRTLRRMTIDDLQQFLDRAGRFVGRPDIIRAMGLLRPNTDSPAETLLRLDALRHGLPCPQTDVVIAKEPWEIRLDMGWPPYRIGLEYQGSHHRDQYEADVDRVNAVLATGWIVFQATATTARDPRLAYQLFENVANALRNAGAPIGHAYVEPLTVLQLTDPVRGRPRKTRHDICPLTTEERFF